ncbi:agmatinase [Vibrio hangzhouensis]|uniref:Guanidinopropionase n=1 Tax=Vibrio hangzhouensis TaxID=462991 RepID=A0A1H5RR09_9VIBR|nr:agmatinase [Vibrio hangzhouensis]SEF40735.1 guanidinopropionase [Vibrio hangzhouensis]
MSQNPQQQPRYSGIATFMRCSYKPSLEDVDIALIGVPFDGGVTNRTGTRHGPREVRNQSSFMRTINQETGTAPFELCRVADVGDALPESPFELTQSHNSIQKFFERVLACGALPIAAGGDHSITLPILRALAKDGPVALVHLDAHCDTGDDYLGSKFHHGSPFKIAVEEGLIDPRKTIQIGIRGTVNTSDIWSFSHESGMRVIYMEEFYQLGITGVLDEIKLLVGEAPVYVTFDVDCLDPAFAPGTGTPEIGGMTSYDALQVIRGLSGLNIIGADVVEVSPPFDPTGVTALVGATIMFELLCIAAESKHRKDRATGG